MDLNDKLKFYRQSTTTRTDRPEQTGNNLADQLGGIVLNPAEPHVIKIEIPVLYSHFIPDWENRATTQVLLPSLTRKQFEHRINLEDILIFDLETTGLAGGTGTFAFLIGVGTFHESFLRVIQYFLPDYGRETGAFRELELLMQKRNVILSYNGKSFDYPLLRNRFVLNRFSDPFAGAEHLDLLHPVRRLWKPILGDCSLGSVEREIFRFSRLNDIDGGLIPFAYFDFLRTGQTNEIQRILWHNQQDIISLARLLVQLHALENNPETFSQNPEELFMLMRQAIKNRDTEAVAFYRQIISNRGVTVPDEILVDLSVFQKRLEDWDAAVGIWNDLLDRGREISFACEELAKYYEHRFGDLNKATALCLRALRHLEMIEEINGRENHSGTKAAFVHRLQRLTGKTSRGDL